MLRYKLPCVVPVGLWPWAVSRAPSQFIICAVLCRPTASEGAGPGRAGDPRGVPLLRRADDAGGGGAALPGASRGQLLPGWGDLDRARLLPVSAQVVRVITIPAHTRSKSFKFRAGAIMMILSVNTGQLDYHQYQDLKKNQVAPCLIVYASTMASVPIHVSQEQSIREGHRSQGRSRFSLALLCLCIEYSYTGVLLLFIIVLCLSADTVCTEPGRTIATTSTLSSSGSEPTSSRCPSRWWRGSARRTSSRSAGSWASWLTTRPDTCSNTWVPLWGVGCP